MTLDTQHQFFVKNLQVLAVHAEVDSADEPHITWVVSVEPVVGESGTHVVIGTLHCVFERTRAEISVGGQFTPIQPKPISTDLLPDLIRDSSALETLYDFARSSLAGLASAVGTTTDMPMKSPLAEVELFPPDAVDAPS
jgi:hypothetical protein